MTIAPTRQALAIPGRSAPGKVTGKLKTALDAMVWDGSRRDAAAEQAGLKVHGLREALRKPHVKAYYLAQLDVLRTSERARNIHTLVEVRDDPANKMARVQAVKALEQLSDDPVNSSASMRMPGLSIVIVQAVPGAPLTAHQQQIEANPLISHDRVQDDE